MKIVTSWDDACKHDLRLAELLEKHELPATFYWQTNLEKAHNVGKVKEFLTMEDCIEISKKFEVGSHTVTHQYLTELNVKQARNEVFISKQIWESVLGRPITSFCYPRGRQNSIVRMLVKNAGYTNARTTVVGWLEKSTDPILTNTTVHVGMDRVEYKGKNWEDYARDMLVKARAKDNSIFHVFGHSWEIERNNDWQALDDFFKELKA